MKNPSFKVYLNNEFAGNGTIDAEFGVLTTIVTWVRRSMDNTENLTLEMSGLDSVDKKRLVWVNSNLTVGDEITIKVTDEDDNSSQPKNVSKTFSEEQELQNKLRTYHRLQEELKDYL